MKDKAKKFKFFSAYRIAFPIWTKGLSVDGNQKIYQALRIIKIYQPKINKFMKIFSIAIVNLLEYHEKK